MKIRTYMELSDVIADLARLDAAIQSKHYVFVRDSLEELGHIDINALKALRSALEDITVANDAPTGSFSEVAP